MLVDHYCQRTDCDAADIVIEFAPEVPGFGSRCIHGHLAQGRSPLVAIKAAVDACRMVNRYWQTRTK